MSLNEFWLISAPGEKTCQQTWDKMNATTSKQHNLSANNKFHVPDLKVGTLDALVGLSDDLGKMDAFVESIARKVAHYFGEVLEDQSHNLSENLLANGMDLATYMTHFQWDMAKYPIKQSLRNISEQIAKQVSNIDNDLKVKSSAYNQLKINLQSLERKATGSLLTRNLIDLVKKEDFVLDSEYLTTLIVVIPNHAMDNWNKSYEKLSDMVVPRSSRKIAEDDDFRLMSVTLFKKVVDEYKMHCREQKFIVRDFVYDEEQIHAGKDQVTKLNADKKKQHGPLVRWLKVNFSEAFTAWIHIKALRVFVESVLRYGLPVNFQAMLLRPNKKTSRKLREVLNQLYSHLDTTSGDGGMDFEIPGLNIGGQDYYPYVCYTINIDFVSH